jgi:hypothetical protein
MLGPDVLALLIRAQNAGIIIRHFQHETIFESFEVSPQPAVVMAAKGKLLCSYPGPAIAVPREKVDHPTFRQELASFLAQMNVDVLDSAPTTTKAKSEVREERDTAHPRYITQLLTEILRGMGHVAEVTRIRKRIADDVLWSDAFKPWRRSSIWLLIRVALQTSLYQEFHDHIEYKVFMVFMMAKILRLCLEKDFPSDLIFCMRAKMSRRLLKLGSAAPGFVLEFVGETGDMAQSLLQKRWSKVQADQAASTPWAPDHLDIASDTRLSLLNSKPYLSRVLLDGFASSQPYTFRPDHFRRFSNSSIFSAKSDLSTGFTQNAHVGLLDFELAVQDHLDYWVANNLKDTSSCSIIAACITQYADAALSAYESNPETLSIMLLTVLELWVGLDKMAIAQCPLLREYTPEIPPRLLGTLLLRKLKSFRRLESIETYLRKRHGDAVQGSVFTNDLNRNTFAVRYYDTSEEHHILRARIEEDATRHKKEKIEELERLNVQHHDLMERSRSLSDHKYWTDRRGRPKHCRSCKKCSLQSQAANLTIQVYEWPLPRNDLELKVVVFELLLPLEISIWRATTYKILRDICMLAVKPPVTPPVKLDDYDGLKNYHGAHSRLILASETKSFSNSHYRTTHIPSDADSVCVNNGLRFRCIISG